MEMAKCYNCQLCVVTEEGYKDCVCPKREDKDGVCIHWNGKPMPFWHCKLTVQCEDCGELRSLIAMGKASMMPNKCFPKGGRPCDYL